MAKKGADPDSSRMLKEIDAQIETMFPGDELRDALERMTEGERNTLLNQAPTSREVTRAAIAIATIRLMMAKKGGYEPPESLKPFMILIED